MVGELYFQVQHVLRTKLYVTDEQKSVDKGIR